MKLYKLTNQNMETHNGFKWQIGETYSLPKIEHPKMCSSDVYHAYKNLNLGLLLNPIHADIKDPMLFECHGDICVEDWSKCGTFELTLDKKLDLPQWYLNSGQRKRVNVRFAVYCAESVLEYFENVKPSDNRPRKAIEDAKTFLSGEAAADAAAYAAADAADAADAVARAVGKEIDFGYLADKAVEGLNG